MKQIIKQSFEQLRSQKVLTIVSITGTALAIFLIMVVVMFQQVKVAEFAPESNRGRMLHAHWGSIEGVDHPEYQSNGGMSIKSATRLGDIKEAETSTVYQAYTQNVNVKQAGNPSFGTDMRTTDANYWRVFDFTFLHGKPYDKATVEASQHSAVIDAGTARRLFGTEDAVGREFLMDYTPFTVCGVVKEVSTLAENGFAHIWVPNTAIDESTWNGELMGSHSLTILAGERGDFDAIRAAFERNMAEYNKEIVSTGWNFVTRGRPFDQEQEACSPWANTGGDVQAERRNRLIIYLILLIVPAINLSCMTESRLRQRVEEVGVRRAFGCTRSQIVTQLFNENLVITLIAGMVGWLLSVVFALLCSAYLFADDYSNTATSPTIDLGMLVQPATFLWAMLFCFILNLLSSGLPAWKASRANIVNALNRH